MAKKVKVPKKIAGVKVPEAVRHPGWMAEAMTSPVMREAIAAALVAGAAAAAGVLSRNNGGTSHALSDAPTEHKPGASLGKELTEVAMGAVAGMATQAAKSMLTSRAGKQAKKASKTAATKTTAAAAPKRAGPRRTSPA